MLLRFTVPLLLCLPLSCFSLRLLADSDPFAYAVRSLAQNEFLSPKYAIVPPQLTTTLGIGYLDAFGL